MLHGPRDSADETCAYTGGRPTRQRRSYGLLLVIPLLASACASVDHRASEPSDSTTQEPRAADLRRLATERVIADDDSPRAPALIERPEGHVGELPEKPVPLPADAGWGDRLDYDHDSAFLWANRTLEAADHWLADPEAELDPVPVSPMMLGLRTTLFDRTDGLDWDFKFDTDLKVKLPNTERRLRLVITSDTVGEAPLQDADSLGDVSIGSRWAVTRAVDFDVGIKARIWPELFAAVRWSRAYRQGPWELYPFAKAFVTTDQGLGASSGVTLDYWTGPYVARSSSWAQWLRDDDFPQWTQYFVLARVERLIADRRFVARVRGEDVAHGFGLILGARRTLEEFSGASIWAAQLFYKWPLRGNWMYMTVAPGVRWEREYGYHPDGVIRIGIEMLFWGVQRR
ncbi:MAG TPA: hypothetical protein VLT59_02245 [Steroidobacteraceae bacterium]|nr:hypothetical protein [Steroidobacteraceae bacterium]